MFFINNLKFPTGSFNITEYVYISQLDLPDKLLVINYSM